MAQIVKDTEFSLVSELVKLDAKKRISLGGTVREEGVAYHVYQNRIGQIVLDPVKAIPAYEAWLFENPEALAAVKQGLQESAEGKRIDLGSFAEHATESEE